MNITQIYAFLGALDQMVQDPGEQASQAITDGDMPLLMGLMSMGRVDLNTQNPQGVTLLMQSVRQLNHPAFFLLLTDRALRSIDPDLLLHDGQHNTLLHDIANHMPDGFFDEPSDHPAWRELLEGFFGVFREWFDWRHLDNHGETAIQRAEALDKESLVAFLETYIPAEDDPGASEEAEASEEDEPPPSTESSDSNPDGADGAIFA